jgi:hypothetical protein
MTKDPKEYAAFEEMIRDHFAQLATVTAEYTRRMYGPRWRDYFLEKVLEKAWERRKLFNPARQSVAQWWAACCDIVALSRREWEVWYITGPKFIKGKHLRDA